MKISTCIQELLLENETVIIPGFGAFISNYKPAEIHPENDEIKPPSKELSFSQKIRNNDGLLVGYIAGKEGISHFDALKKIEKDRENFIYQLDKGEKITFENIGILFRNKNNEIEFESFQKENLLLDSYGLDTTSLTPDEPDGVEENINEQEEPVPVVETENTEPEVTNGHDSKESDEISRVSSAFIKEQLVFRTADPEDQYKRKKRGWFWFLLIFIPILVAGYFLYTKQNQNVPPPRITEGTPVQDNEVIKSEEILPTDSTKVDSAQKESAGTFQTETSHADQTATKVKNQGNYYLVAGSFKEEENAEKFLQEFNVEGFKPFHLGKRGNFYIVAIGRYNTEKEAVVAQNKFIEKNPDSGTWVFKDENN